MLKGSLLTLFGILLFLFGAGIIFATFLPVISAELTYYQNKNSQGNSPNTNNARMAPLDSQFGIIIPKFRANARIIPDVDPNNAAAYQQALSQGVAHAKGTAYPGDLGNVFLFAHSSVDFYQATRFNAVFYLIGKLNVGDKIFLYYKGQKIVYSVEKKLIVSPQEISYMDPDSKEERLTLMTCWPAGTTLKRQLVIAKRDLAE